ncbi:hypothetical protein BJ944DRAFT_272407 [Cunninghamella echinulata]|nr:hypothetical protein BJ944DRAFT_272407 [Cunninghamella echinulata]
MYQDNDNQCLIPGFEIISLTADEPEWYNNNDQQYEDDSTMIDWIDDCEAQENLFQIIPLTPEEAICDQDNHIISTAQSKLFFEELGYFCEEPEAIDPTMNYEAEYQIKMNHQQELISKNNNKKLKRQHHIDLGSSSSSSSSSTCSPELTTSAASSFHHTEDDDDDDLIRSPYPLNRSYLPYQYHTPTMHSNNIKSHHHHITHASSNLRYH